MYLKVAMKKTRKFLIMGVSTNFDIQYDARHFVSKIDKTECWRYKESHRKTEE